MGASRSVTVTVRVDDDSSSTTSDLMAFADVVTGAAAELLPGATTRLVVSTADAAPVPPDLPATRAGGPPPRRSGPRGRAA